MKYVIFKHKTVYMPILFPDHVTHSTIKIEGAEPVSAGFINTTTGEVFGLSESLKLEPNEEIDAELCLRVLSNYGVYAFMDMNGQLFPLPVLYEPDDSEEDQE